MQKSQLKLYLDPDDKSAIEYFAAIKKMSVTALISLILEEYLEEQRKNVLYEMQKRGLVKYVNES